MKEIKKKLLSIVELVNRLESEPRNYGTGDLLTGTDIHLIEIIGDNDNVSVSDIARLFGVTKGAVSQKLKHLTSLGLTLKAKDPENLSRAIVVLTTRGREAYLSHKKWHANFDEGFQEYSDSLKEDQQIVIFEYLNKVERLFRNLLSNES